MPTLTNRQTLSQPKPLCNDSSVLNLHHGYYTTIMTSRRLFCHNQKIGIRIVYGSRIIILNHPVTHCESSALECFTYIQAN